MSLNKTEIEGNIIRNKGKLYGVKFEPLNKKAMMNIMEIYIDNLEPYYKLKRDKKLEI